MIWIVSHRIRRPVSQTIAEGQTAQFTVAASGVVLPHVSAADMPIALSQ